MPSRGGDFLALEQEDGLVEIRWWKRCEVPDCPNYVCIGRSELFCYPHSGGQLERSPALERLRREMAWPVER